MKKNKNISRRHFIKKGSIFFGLGTILRLFPVARFVNINEYIFDIKFKVLSKVDIVWNKLLKKMNRYE